MTLPVKVLDTDSIDYIRDVRKRGDGRAKARKAKRRLARKNRKQQ